MKTKKEVFCGKDLRKFLYVVGAFAAVILLGSYIYKDLEKGAGLSFWATGASVVTPQGASLVQAAAARPITVAGSPFSSVAAFIKPSVVNISATRSTTPLKGKPALLPNRGGGLSFANPFTGVGVQSIGAGIIITKDGYVLTNYHVVEKATEVYVTIFLPQGSTRVRAEIIRLSELLDLALLKVDASVVLRPAPLGDSDRMLVGDQILAIGNPFGLDQTVSQGIISSKREAIVIEGITHRNLLQTDAAINQGNSGGPLVNLDGYVVGVNTAIYTPTGAFAGVGFAVPINEAREFLEEVIALPQAKANIKQALKMDARARTATGVQVAIRQAPPIAANAPMPHNDRGPCANCHKILPAGGNMGVNVPVAGAYQFSTSPGGALGVNAALPAGVSPQALGLRGNWFGAEVQNIDQVVARSFRSPTVEGAFVNSVYTGSPAGMSGLKSGDIIFMVNGRRFSTAHDLSDLAKLFDKGDSVRVSIFRNGARRDIYLEVGAVPESITPALGAIPGVAPQQAPPAPVFWGNGEVAPNLQTGIAPNAVPKEFAWLGMELEPLRLNEAATDPQFVGKSGALVVELAPGSPAANAGIRSGDLVLAINQTPVGTAKALNNVIWKSGSQSGALIELERGLQRMFVTIR